MRDCPFKKAICRDWFCLSVTPFFLAQWCLGTNRGSWNIIVDKSPIIQMSLVTRACLTQPDTLVQPFTAREIKRLKKWMKKLHYLNELIALLKYLWPLSFCVEHHKPMRLLPEAPFCSDSMLYFLIVFIVVVLLWHSFRLWQSHDHHQGCDHSHQGHEAQAPGPTGPPAALRAGAEEAVHSRGRE